MFRLCGNERILSHFEGDVCNFSQLKEVFDSVKPQFVFHLAAQALVSEGYNFPMQTYAVNVMGRSTFSNASARAAGRRACSLLRRTRSMPRAKEPCPRGTGWTGSIPIPTARAVRTCRGLLPPQFSGLSRSFHRARRQRHRRRRFCCQPHSARLRSRGAGGQGSGASPSAGGAAVSARGGRTVHLPRSRGGTGGAPCSLFRLQRRPAARGKHGGACKTFLTLLGRGGDPKRGGRGRPA